MYSEQGVNEYFDSKQGRGRTLFVIMEGSEAAGELQLKRFDYEKSECAVGIHMKNDSFKGRGCGTRALELGAEYAFEVLNMKAVNADALITNARSRRALCKAGFGFVCEDGRFAYYRKER